MMVPLSRRIILWNYRQFTCAFSWVWTTRSCPLEPSSQDLPGQHLWNFLGKYEGWIKARAPFVRHLRELRQYVKSIYTTFLVLFLMVEGHSSMDDRRPEETAM